MADADPQQCILAVNAGRRAECGAAHAAAAEAALERAFTVSHRLAVYGTLAPGESNHHLLAACRGQWQRGTVPGRRAEREHPAFTYDPAGAPVAVQVLTSADLPGQWRRLDAFEAPTHRRILVPVFLGGRLMTVANLYEACTPVPPA